MRAFESIPWTGRTVSNNDLIHISISQSACVHAHFHVVCNFQTSIFDEDFVALLGSLSELWGKICRVNNNWLLYGTSSKSRCPILVLFGFIEILLCIDFLVWLLPFYLQPSSKYQLQLLFYHQYSSQSNIYQLMVPEYFICAMKTLILYLYSLLWTGSSQYLSTSMSKLCQLMPSSNLLLFLDEAFGTVPSSLAPM